MAMPSQNDHMTTGSVDDMISQQFAAVENKTIQSLRIVNSIEEGADLSPEIRELKIRFQNS